MFFMNLTNSLKFSNTNESKRILFGQRTVSIYSKFLLDYFLISNLMFLVGFLDDIKIKISPSKRLVLMILFLLILIHFIPIKILNIDVQVLSSFLKNDIFSSLFLLLCFCFYCYYFFF